MGLPDLPGLDVVRSLRAHGHAADVIAVTSVRDLEMVRSAVSLGAQVDSVVAQLRPGSGSASTVPKGLTEDLVDSGRARQGNRCPGVAAPGGHLRLGLITGTRYDSPDSQVHEPHLAQIGWHRGAHDRGQQPGGPDARAVARRA